MSLDFVTLYLLVATTLQARFLALISKKNTKVMLTHFKVDRMVCSIFLSMHPVFTGVST